MSDMRRVTPLQILGGIFIAWTSVIQPLLGGLGNVDTVCNVLRLPEERCGSGTMISAILAGDWWQPALILMGVGFILWGERKRNEASRLAPGQDSYALETGDLPPTNDPLTGLTADRLFVAEIGVDGNKLDEEHRLEVWLRFFNATDVHLTTVSVDGAIDCHILAGSSIPEENKLKLPPASLIRDRSPLHDIPPLTETIIVLQQHLSPKLAARLTEALAADGFQLFFDDLKITVADLEDRATTAEIPISSGTFLRHRDGLYSGRVTRLSVNAAISG
jgi:hypothetical protein